MATRSIVTLGTSSQVPKKNRNHIGLFLRWDKEDILFDPGEGTQRQMITFGVPLNRIKKIFITHFHGDHCLGLPGIIQRLSLHQISHPVDIIFPKSGENHLKSLLSSAIFHNRVNLRFIPVEKSGEIELEGDIRAWAMRLEHGVDTFGYKIADKKQWNILPHRLPEKMDKKLIPLLKERGWIEFNGKKIFLQEVAVEKEGQSFAFCMDTKYCDSALELAKDTTVLACESTYLDEDRSLAQKYLHLTAKEAAHIASVSNTHLLILMHFSQRYTQIFPFEKEAREVFPNSVAAHDGMKMELPPIKRKLSRPLI